MASLAQLATDSGGRYTENANDLSLGYVRAQRDAGCVYTIGVYVQAGDEDKVRNLAVNIKRPGLRAVHPSKYVFRSEQEKRTSKLRAAWIAPSMFETGVVRAHAFTLKPASKKAWDSLLTISFTVPLGSRNGEPAERLFGAVLRQGSRIAARFSRRLTLTPNDTGVDSSPSVTFVEPVTLAPGSYTLTALMSDPDETEHHATEVTLEVPEIPRRDTFLVPPILSRPAGTNLVVHSKGDGYNDRIGDETSFQPLLVAQLDQPEDLVALTQICEVGKVRQRRKAGEVVRALRATSGQSMGTLDPVALKLAGEDRVRCQPLLDLLPGSVLPEGDYVFEVALRPVKPGVEAEAESFRFSIGAGSLFPDEESEE